MKDAGINFLPWREVGRLRQRRLFFVLLVLAALAGCAASAALSNWNMRAVAVQEQRNGYLQMRLAQLAPRERQLRQLLLRREHATREWRALLALEDGRWQAAGLLHMLAQRVPESVSLESISVSAERCVLRGVAAAPEVLPQMVRELGRSSWLQQPRLQEMGVEEQQAGGARRYFVLHAELSPRAPVIGSAGS